MVKNLLANAGDASSIPELGKSPGDGNGNPLQHSCLENPTDRGASDHQFAFLLSFFFGMALFAGSCMILQTSIHSPSGTLPTRPNPLKLFITFAAYS